MCFKAIYFLTLNKCVLATANIVQGRQWRACQDCLECVSILPEQIFVLL